MPSRYAVPPQITEAMLVIETGFMPQELSELSEELIEKMMLYKSIKNVTEHGGDWQP